MQRAAAGAASARESACARWCAPHDVAVQREREARRPEDGGDVEVDEADRLHAADSRPRVAVHELLQVEHAAEDVDERGGRIGDRQEDDQPDREEALRQLAEAQHGEEDDAGAEQREQCAADDNVPASGTAQGEALQDRCRVVARSQPGSALRRHPILWGSEPLACAAQCDAARRGAPQGNLHRLAQAVRHGPAPALAVRLDRHSTAATPEPYAEWEHGRMPLRPCVRTSPRGSSREVSLLMEDDASCEQQGGGRRPRYTELPLPAKSAKRMGSYLDTTCPSLATCPSLDFLPTAPSSP
eukprot:5052005-Prymnesium_polylepis.1